MIFLFEQFAYKQKFLEKVLPQTGKESNWALPKGFVKKTKSEDLELDGVGYLFNGEIKENEISNKTVFVLPKVFLDENGTSAFGELIHSDGYFALPEGTSKEFLAQLSLWVCSSISKYRKENPDDGDIEYPEAKNFCSSSCPTLIDVMNSMKLFYDENKNLFVFVSKNKHSGNNRIDWHRTVAKAQPFWQNGVPIYMDLENKKKVLDLDDRLLVLYFSAMNYIEEMFGFKMPKSEFYVPLRMSEFRRLFGHRGLMELRRIKHKYFADKFLKLYNIMKAFFEWGANFSAGEFKNEYLLTSKYNNVFESMIDELVGDGAKVIQDKKNLDDGKIIDHLYKERSLIFSSSDSDQIWHIGDSKYYKDKTDIVGESIAKQFTYAKNVIQDFFSPNFFENGSPKSPHENVRYRDELTEGYSVTPNFFIRGELPSFSNPQKQFEDPYFRCNSYEPGQALIRDADEVSEEFLWKIRNRQFENRLFDRDTLLLQVYNVNFLYVLKAYTSKHSAVKDEFKQKARTQFRNNFLKLLDEKYVFWALWPIGSEKDFVDKHFKMLVGKLFKPVEFGCIILALERDSVPSIFDEENSKNDWAKVWSGCESIRISPYEIWEPDNTYVEVDFGKLNIKDSKPNASDQDQNFDGYFDEKKNGLFIRRKKFEELKIGKEKSLPKSWRGHLLQGNIFGDTELDRIQIQKSDIDDFFFLPCRIAKLRPDWEKS